MSNHAAAMYRKMVLMFTKGIHIRDVLSSMGITSIYLYGIGEMGRVVINDLAESEMILSAYDKSVIGEKHITINDRVTLSIFGSECIPDDSIPILVSQAANTVDIMKDLADKGIDRKRLVSLNLILEMGYSYVLKERTTKFSLYDKHFLIVGANFDNKGAQAMTFVVVDTLRKEYPTCNIWFCPNFQDDIYERDDYSFFILSECYRNGSLLYEAAFLFDAIIDVSGYAVASMKNFGSTDRMVTSMKLGYDLGIPYYIMPQSFGPMDFPGYRLAELGELLSKSKVIFARELTGYNLLKEKLGLSNVYKSNDMVLQYGQIDASRIYEKHARKLDRFNANGGVVIVPNGNLLLYEEESRVIEFYQWMIRHLLSINEKVYIIPHSYDNVMCDKIYDGFTSDERVKYINEEMDCIDFEHCIRDSKFLVASRYHAVVHAYKEGVPCIIIGWAEKYKELSELFAQEKYLFDVREGLDKNAISEAIKQMSEENEYEAEKIANLNKSIVKIDLFETLWRDIDN